MSVLKVFRARTSPEAIDLVSRLLEYTPSARITPLQVATSSNFWHYCHLLNMLNGHDWRRKRKKLKYYQACAHTFFDELREPGTKLPSGRELPVLFNFTEQVNWKLNLLGSKIPETVFSSGTENPAFSQFPTCASSSTGG